LNLKLPVSKEIETNKANIYLIIEQRIDIYSL